MLPPSTALTLALADREPDGMVTPEGTLAMAGLELERLISWPFGPAGEEMPAPIGAASPILRFSGLGESVIVVGAALLTAVNSLSPTFVADVAGTYVAQLVVSDPYSSSSPVTVGPSVCQRVMLRFHTLAAIQVDRRAYVHILGVSTFATGGVFVAVIVTGDGLLSRLPLFTVNWTI